MNRKSLFLALACALLVFSMLGCGSTNKLQSITLQASLINGVAPTGQAGFFTLEGNGGTIQLLPMGTLSNGKTRSLANEAVTYTMIVDPINDVDAFGNKLPLPCTKGVTCPFNSTQGTAEISPTGLVTAVEPATCTWVDIAPVVTVGTAPPPAWFYSGDYAVTVTFQGITSQPVYIPVASSAGNQSNSALGAAVVDNNPTGACGSSSS